MAPRKFAASAHRGSGGILPSGSTLDIAPSCSFWLPSFAFRMTRGLCASSRVSWAFKNRSTFQQAPPLSIGAPRSNAGGLAKQFTLPGAAEEEQSELSRTWRAPACISVVSEDLSVRAVMKRAWLYCTNVK